MNICPKMMTGTALQTTAVFSAYAQREEKCRSLAGNPWDIMLSYPQHTEVIWIIADDNASARHDSYSNDQ